MQKEADRLRGKPSELSTAAAAALVTFSGARSPAETGAAAGMGSGNKEVLAAAGSGAESGGNSSSSLPSWIPT